MVSSVANYVGRTVDLSAFRPVGAPGRTTSVLLAQELIRPGEGGTLVAGIQKLAQRVLIILLNKMGSHPYRSDYGTLFMDDAERGVWRTAADVEQSFYSARTDLRRQIQAVETDADPADERYSTLDLTGITLVGSKVTLQLTLTSLAGTTYVYLTPIAVPIR